MNEVNTDNRKVSYHENTKYSSMDNLIEEFQKHFIWVTRS
jgi:hypothetical protein